ncbi:MAG: hypothetical protein ACR652_08845 [Methylocystis sp.]|uniref:hypothetical protein n=1 Tax=Methylocystis sp. TaxID=1911079 RepID=UPI003DA3F114
MTGTTAADTDGLFRVAPNWRNIHYGIEKDEIANPFPHPDRCFRPPKYELTSEEAAAVKRGKQRRSARAPAPRVKIKQNERSAALIYDHPDQDFGRFLLAEAHGTADGDFLGGLLSQLVNIRGDVGARRNNLIFLFLSSRTSSRAINWNQCWQRKWRSSTRRL